MKPAETVKKFDCLEFKRRVQTEIYDQIKSLTAEQQREYFRKGAESGSLGAWWKEVKKRADVRP